MTAAAGVAAEARVGTELAGYSIEALLGRGGMGVVYLASDPWLERKVALKVLLPELSERARFRERFLRESKLAASLEHANVVPIYEAGEAQGLLYLAMRYVEGPDLGTLLAQEGRLDPKRALAVLEQVAIALDAAHAKGLVHRDVKPGNILLSSNSGDGERAYLSDFGLSKTATGMTDFTEAGQLAGTLRYMAPEQVQEAEVSPRTDVYALGCVLFECLTGAPPYAHEAAMALLWAHLEEEPPRISEWSGDLPAALDAVVARALSKEPVERFESCEELIAAAAEKLGEAGTAIAARQASRNPYKGLRAFDEADADDFFGRDALVGELLDRLAHPEQGRLVALVGSSGSGKSSVIKAGLLPRLAQGAVRGSTEWTVLEALPGDPISDLEAGIEALSRPGSSRLVVVIDQFEELFTMVADESRREAFVSLVVRTAERGDTSIVLTLRADFYDRPLRYRELSRLLERGLVTVHPLEPEELERAIVAPAERVGVEMEHGLVADIVADVVDQPGALPLMQYALTELFERRTTDRITVDDYHAIGGVTGAIGRRADDLYSELDAAGQHGARLLFTRLVTLGEGTEDTRRRILRSEVDAIAGSEDAIDDVIDGYGRHRLLSFDRDSLSGSPTVEIAHEALLREWPRLRRWIDDDRAGLRVLRHLSEAAVAWEAASRDDGDLYRGARLEQALALQEQRPDELNPLETEFLDASRELSEAEARAEQERQKQRIRQNRRLRIALAVVAVLLVGAVAAGVVALEQSRRADREATDATAARDAAETRRLASDAGQLVGTDRRLALLLATEAHNRDPGAITLGALQRVLTGTEGFLGYVGSDRDWTDVEFLGSDRVAATSREGLSVFRVADGEEVLAVPLPASRVTASPGGDTLAVASGGSVRLVDPRSGEVADSVLEHPSEVLSLAFSTDGNTLATGDRDGSVRLWRLPEGSLGREIAAHPERFPDEVEGVPPGFTIGTRHQPETAPIGVTSLALSADGSQLVTAGLVVVRLWDTRTGRALLEKIVDRPAQVDMRVLTPPLAVDLPVGRPGVIRIGTGFTTMSVAARTGATLEEAEIPQRSSTGSLEAVRSSLALGRSALALGFVPGAQAVFVPPDPDSPHVVADTLLAGDPAVALAADERTAAYAGAGGILLWALDGRGLISRSVRGEGDIAGGAAALSPDGRVLYIENAIGPGRQLWDISERRPRPIRVNEAEDVYFMWAGDRVFSREDDGSVIGRNPESLEPTGVTYGTRFGGVFAWAMSRDGTLVGLGSGGALSPERGATVRIYDAGSGELRAKLDDLVQLGGRDAFVSSIAFSPDGRRLVATTGSGAALVWSTETWRPIKPPLSGGGGAVSSAGWTPDGRWLVTGSLDGLITLRDPVTYQPDGEPLVGNTSGVQGFAAGLFGFTPDNRYLVTISDAHGRIWDLEARELVGDAFRTDIGTSAGTNENASAVATYAGDRVLIWSLDLGAWPSIACRAAGRNLTLDEWQQHGPAGEPYRGTCPQWPSAAGSSNEPDQGEER